MLATRGCDAYGGGETEGSAGHLDACELFAQLRHTCTHRHLRLWMERAVWELGLRVGVEPTNEDLSQVEKQHINDWISDACEPRTTRLL